MTIIIIGAIILHQIMLKAQDSQLTGKARVKKVEILEQKWCDHK